MNFAIDLNRDDRAAAEALLPGVTWNQPTGRDYFIAPVRDDANPLFAGYRRAFFVRIPPGGNVHAHTDDSASKVFDTDHIVVATNKRCRLYWQIENNTFSKRLELGHRYRIADRGVLHWAENNGQTDRIHLLIEYPKF